jgi:hypothetical protein
MDPDADPDPAIFIIDPSRCQKKKKLKKFASLLKDKKSKRSHKTVEIKVFPTIFA